MYNAKMRSTTAELKEFKLADGGSKGSMAFERNMLDGYQRISDSIIIGDSPNMGSGQWIRVWGDNIHFLNSALVVKKYQFSVQFCDLINIK